MVRKVDSIVMVKGKGPRLRNPTSLEVQSCNNVLSASVFTGEFTQLTPTYFYHLCTAGNNLMSLCHQASLGIRQSLYHCDVKRHERNLHLDTLVVVLSLRVDVGLVVGEDVADDAVRLIGVGGTAWVEGDGEHCREHVTHVLMTS